MYFLYNIALWLALPFVVAYHLYRSVSRGRRPAFGERFGFAAQERLAVPAGEKTFWVHAVSVGETIAVKPLLKALKSAFPKSRIVLSNGTETGRSIAVKIAEVDHAIYFPFDYRFAVTRALARVRPSLVVVVETEIWPNFLRAARKMGVPALLVNGRISDRSFGRYLKLSWFFRPVLADIAAFCMQTAEDARRIVAIGAEPARVHVARNLKYDIPVNVPSPGNKRELRADCGIPEGVMVFTAGSTHAGEEEMVVAAYMRILAEGRDGLLVLAPRHPERAGEVAEILGKAGLPFTRRSALDRREREFRPGEVLLVDTVGELMRFYALADAVFVGGSLVATGGHNILEPASLGVPVMFGPHMHNFREAAEIILASGGGLQVRDGEELAASLKILLDDEERRRAMGESGVKLLLANSGATEKHMEVIRKLLASNDSGFGTRNSKLETRN
jgi:3-deoxy-D-manno-octulosonic-acid transferase